MNIHDLETPAATINLDRVEANINKFQQYANTHKIANRPHIKTHKIPAIAHIQLKAGASGITCQKIGEAEVMAQAGITDIFIPYNIIGAAKLERLAALMKVAKISVTVDSEYTAKGLSEMAQRHGVELPVLIEFDTGSQRCGVQTPDQADVLAWTVACLPGLRFGGLMTYPANDQTDPFVEQVRDLVGKRGLQIEQVTVGGTPGMWNAHTHKAITEYRVGTYVYGDRYTVKSGVQTVDECAMRIITTVVSRPTADRGILDGGSKTFSSDLFGMDGHGLILEYPEAKFYGLSEEHGHVDFSACANRPEIGERVSVIPNHCCVVTNLFNEVVGIRGDQVEVVWPVAARGLLT
jgi:D-serine deaminase-like pyridoxal phosphate-dependent protein